MGHVHLRGYGVLRKDAAGETERPETNISSATDDCANAHQSMTRTVPPCILPTHMCSCYALDRVYARQPSEIHQRIPTFLGSVEDVLELESYGDVQQLGDKKYAV